MRYIINELATHVLREFFQLTRIIFNLKKKIQIFDNNENI